MKTLILVGILTFLTSCGGSNFKATNSETPDTVTPIPPDVVEEAAKDLDVLIVLDDSGSMLEDNQKLASYLGDLVSELNSDEVNWQMCITTTDVEYYEGRTIIWRENRDSNIISSDIPSATSDIISSTINWIGHGWSDDEQGIKAMNMALNESANDGCFRDAAALAVILISDEDERSVGGDESLSSEQYKELEDMNSPYIFMDNIFSKFGSGKRVIAHSIIVNDDTCKSSQDSEGSESFIGTQYRVLSTLTGGSVISICDSNYLSGLSFFGDDVKQSLAL